jgi:hypothetical protein
MTEQDQQREGVPRELLLSPVFIEACQARDIGAVFRLAKRHAGIYPSRIARLVEMTPSRVGEIMTGRRTVASMTAIERIADGLRIPGHMLGLARRAWEPVDRPESSPIAPIPPRRQPGGPPSSQVSDTGADLAVIDSFRQADRRLGGRHLYTAVVGHLTYSLAPRLVADPTGTQAAATFGAAFTLTEMAGWMAHDSGDDHAAHGHFQRAAALARATGNADVEAHVHASLAHLHTQTGDARTALECAQTGTSLATARGAHPQLLARLAAMRARAHSVLGEHYAAEAALGEARSALDLACHAPLAPWVSGFDAAALASEAAQTHLDLGQYRTAIPHARAAVALRTSDRARSLALGRLSLAEAYLRGGELDAACQTGTRLLAESHGVGSARIVTGLQALRRLLALHRTQADAATLLDGIDEALRRGQSLLHRPA